jgi:hypothetical protein
MPGCRSLDALRSGSPEGAKNEEEGDILGAYHIYFYYRNVGCHSGYCIIPLLRVSTLKLDQWK